MTSTEKLPANAQWHLPSSHAVLPNGFKRHALAPHYHTASLEGDHVFDTPLKPFLVCHADFLDIIGANPRLEVIASSESKLGGDGTDFAHEAGVWVEETGGVFFTSNRLEQPTPRILISKIRPTALEEGKKVTNSWEVVKPDPDIVTGNGGTLFGKDVLLCSQGLDNHTPSSLTILSPTTPHTSRVILNNFHGRPFNSMNDVVVLPPPSREAGQPHPTTDRSDLHHLPGTTIWFTDPAYAHPQGLKVAPSLPNQVYCFDPTTGSVRVVADGITMPNGIAFDYAGERCFISDTALFQEESSGKLTASGRRAATIYVYDVVRPTHDADLSAVGPYLQNRRVFAFSDCGIPDGIKCDHAGNVYSGCGDGVQVWNKHGTLLGKVILPPDEPTTRSQDAKLPQHRARGCANFCFIPGGQLVMFAEDRIYKATLGPNVRGALLLSERAGSSSPQKAAL